MRLTRKNRKENGEGGRGSHLLTATPPGPYHGLEPIPFLPKAHTPPPETQPDDLLFWNRPRTHSLTAKNATDPAERNLNLSAAIEASEATRNVMWHCFERETRATRETRETRETSETRETRETRERERDLQLSTGIGLLPGRHPLVLWDPPTKAALEELQTDAMEGQACWRLLERSDSNQGSGGGVQGIGLRN